MTNRQRILIGFYAVMALAALYATWSQNLQVLAGAGPLDGFIQFWRLTGANPASTSITVDLAFFFMAAAAFMVIEARRLGVGFVWLYLLGGVMIAISVTFPLFMIARELKLPRAAGGAAEAAWSLKVIDYLYLAATAAALIAVSVLVYGG
jgi:hypothetical protein